MPVWLIGFVSAYILCSDPTKSYPTLLKKERRVKMYEHTNVAPKRRYIPFFGLRLIFEEGRYVGCYNPRLKKVLE